MIKALRLDLDIYTVLWKLPLFGIYKCFLPSPHNRRFESKLHKLAGRESSSAHMKVRVVGQCATPAHGMRNIEFSDA